MDNFIKHTSNVTNTGNIYTFRGVLRHLMGYKELALADLSEAIKLSPTLSSVALFNRAICYQSVGEREKVCTCIAIVIEY